MYINNIKETIAYKDIRWLMKKINCRDVLERLGIKISFVSGDELIGFCPDHYVFVGRNPSHPKWSINIISGKTQCWTEGRGSNLVWVASRLLKCSPNEAVEWILGEDFEVNSIVIQNMKDDFEKIKNIENSNKENTVLWKHDILNYINNGKMYNTGYEYFMYPPGKSKTLISKDIVDYYSCVQIRSGYYVNRVVVPFYLKGKFVGFCANDILGKERWKKEHPGNENYKKVLYPKGFNRGSYLFGFDDIVSGSIVIINEGVREVMKAKQYGYNAVAILGSYMSNEQIRLLAELNPKIVVLMFDGDYVGYTITDKIASQLKEFFVVANSIVPFGKDPKNLLKEEYDLVYNKAINNIK